MYQAQTGAQNCTFCSPGKSRQDKGATSCEDCRAGAFSDSPGQAECEYCSDSDKYGDEYTSVEGADQCDRCSPSYFYNTRSEKCVHCEDAVVEYNGAPTAVGKGIDCTSTSSVHSRVLESLEIYPGYYRFTQESTNVYQCPVPNNVSSRTVIRWFGSLMRAFAGFARLMLDFGLNLPWPYSPTHPLTHPWTCPPPNSASAAIRRVWTSA